MRHLLLVATCACALPTRALAQRPSADPVAPHRAAQAPVIPLYTGPIPDARPSAVRETTTVVEGDLRVANVVEPTLTVFLPPPGKANGISVVICPGGGYGFLAIRREGWDVAKRMNELGIAAFVLKNRLPDEPSQVDRSIAPLLDAQQAMRRVRELAATYHLDTARIGIIGFSAGGHLAAMVATSFAAPLGEHPGTVSVRPAFAVLVYPVISFADSLTGDRTTMSNLLGSSPSPELVRRFSAERHVSRRMPPVFLVHAQDDPLVPARQSVAFYQAVVHAGARAHLLMQSKGGHGFAVHNSAANTQWPDRLLHTLTLLGVHTRAVRH